MRHVSLADHTSEGGKVDWAAYREADKKAHALDVNDGVYCYLCGALILFSKGYLAMCNSCKKLDEPGEVTHELFVRCPCCKHKISPHDDLYEFYEEGEHQVTCPHCERDYEVTTHVRYSFTSPALGIDDEDDEEGSTEDHRG